MSQLTTKSPGATRREPIDTDIPARLDRLPWSTFHWFLVSALGVTWVLDGLEGTVVAAISPTLTRPDTLGLTAQEMGLAATLYLAGAITGSLVFGHLTDRLGRKRLFTVTLLIYLAGAILTGLSWNFWSFVLFRCLTGMAIGGEYSAINSAIDELIPARVRGRVDLAINGTFWLGAILGAGATVVLLRPGLLPPWLPGWRVAFGLGGVIGFAMIIARQWVPESPRWLLTHGRHAEAEEVMRLIEAHEPDPASLPPPAGRVRIYPGVAVTFGVIVHTLLVRYRSRALLGLVLIASQAFFYNGISFSFPLVLNRDFGVPADQTGLYVLCMAVANLLGPLVLGYYFDTVGRRKMIAGTYALSGLLIIATQLLFYEGRLTAASQTGLWMFTFFFASAAASAGYLTVSEIFPLEMRALAIALFYAVGTAVGGLLAPALFGTLIDTNSKGWLMSGYVFGALLMLAAAAVEWSFGMDAEQKSLEDVAAPLSSAAPGPAGADGRAPVQPPHAAAGRPPGADGHVAANRDALRDASGR
jgi:MFS family permease